MAENSKANTKMPWSTGEIVEHRINGAWNRAHILSSTQCFCYLGRLGRREREQTMWNQKSGAQWTDSGKRVNNNTNNSSCCRRRRRRHFFWHAEHGRTHCAVILLPKIKSNGQDMRSPSKQPKQFSIANRSNYTHMDHWRMSFSIFKKSNFWNKQKEEREENSRESGQFMFFWLLLVQLKQFSSSTSGSSWLIEFNVTN